eukprot:Blabericola_migrator_1__2147@NODE_1593_length_4212_cov_36_797829_g1041_i0_p2_GENE_NODE_1593_length_4212_cov_36_797829_g1041_i0NODE_1593_length_4212_cov_36_797829_g1041_i0_p2_ORF_typecomplete_len304_score30_96Fbox/PF00646_33/0_0085Fbox/PF00646_33/1_2e04Fbox/PF00646_33/1_1e04DUF935/PF06074_12/0_038_NODE_1593_length_4212_cov_36_797829_g1041_i021223033
MRLLDGKAFPWDDVIKFLPITDRFVLAQTCRNLRQCVLCDKYEKQAMMEYLKTSVLFQRPWLYYPFVSQGQLDEYDDMGGILKCLGHIKTWHCLTTRVIKLAPWFVQVKVDTRMTQGLCTEYWGLSSDCIAHYWQAFLCSDGCALNSQWYIPVIGYMRFKVFDVNGSDWHRYVKSDPVPGIERFLNLIYLLTTEPRNPVQGGWSQACKHLGHNLASLSVDDFFSWDNATEDTKALQESVREDLVLAQKRWLSQLAQRYIVPKLLDAGFQPPTSSPLRLKVDRAAKQIHLYGQNHGLLTFDTGI